MAAYEIIEAIAYAADGTYNSLGTNFEFTHISDTSAANVYYDTGNDGYGDVFKIGFDSSSKKWRGILQLDLPQIPFPDGNGEITSIKLSIAHSAVTNAPVFSVYKSLVTEIDPQDCSWTNRDQSAGTAWAGGAGGAAGTEWDNSTDWGTGTANGKITTFAGVTGTTIVDLTTWAIKDKPNWGDKYYFWFISNNEAADAHVTYGGAKYVKISFKNDLPTTPSIYAVPSSNLLDADIKFNTRPTESDLNYLTMAFSKAANITDDAAAPSAGTNGKIIYDTERESYNTGDSNYFDVDTGDGPFLSHATADEQFRMTVWANDGLTTTEAQAAGYTTAFGSTTTGNTIIHERMGITAADDGCGTGGTGGSFAATLTTTIGQEVTLKVVGTGGRYGGKVAKLGVNWDGDATAANDAMDDFNVITFDTYETTKYAAHTFHKAGTYKVNYWIADEGGWRSNSTLACTVTISAGTPVAQLKASRTDTLRAQRADLTHSVVLSGANSYAVGSDTTIKHYKYKHDSSTPVTANPTNNDNSVFSSESKQISVAASLALCAGTDVRVYGLVSVDDDGGAIADSHATFSHYIWYSEDLNPSDTVDDGAVAGFSDHSTTQFYKHIDLITVKTQDAQDTGAYYTVAARNTATSDFSIVNNRIRCDSNTYLWGGHCSYDTGGSVNFNAGGKTATKSGGTFLTNGFAAGMTVEFSGTDSAANDGTFTITSVSNTVMTVAETIVTDTSSALVVKHINDNKYAMVAASYAEQTPTFTHLVTDSADTDSAAVTTTVAFETEQRKTLDLDVQVTSGAIAILSSSLSRTGGIAGTMPLGNRRYPVGVLRTRLGAPTLTMKVRILTQEGLRNLWSLVEGDRYVWATIDSKRIDSPALPYRELRMRLSGGTIDRDPSLNNHYAASLNFIVIGEDVA